MKRFQIVILTIMLASLSACATNSLPSSSTESSVSISVSNPQDFLSELEDMETGQILEELKISDGGYTEDCFSVLSKRLVEFPEDTLRILKHSKLMTDEKFEELGITGIRSEISYTGSDEEKKALYKYLKSASTGGEYAEMASKILDGWTFEGERIPNHKIEFSAQESEQSNCAISITIPQRWKFQEKTKKNKKSVQLVTAIMNHTREIKIPCRSYILHFGLGRSTDLIQTAGMMWLKQTNMERLHLQQ